MATKSVQAPVCGSGHSQYPETASNTGVVEVTSGVQTVSGTLVIDAAGSLKAEDTENDS